MEDLWENDENDDDVLILALALAVEGAQRKKKRRRRKNYLRREDLHQTPRASTAWEALYNAGNDQAFILTTGLDVANFHRLLDDFERVWDATPIPRDDVSVDGLPRPERRSLSACAALALVLHYLNSTMAEHSLQLVFAVTPSVCSRYLRFGLLILEAVLRTIPDARIAWPSEEDEFAAYASMINLKHPLLVGGFCFVDGLNLPVAVSSDMAVQRAYHNGWTCSHYCSCVFGFAPDGRIIYASLNAPGLWHDAAIARELYIKLLTKTPEGYFAIADTAFPRSQSSIQGRIKTPLKKNDAHAARLRTEGRENEYRELVAFHEQLVSARQAAEWGMRAFQGSFGRLKLPLPADDHVHRRRVLEVCARLHQIRTLWVGANQIRAVYEAVWREDDDDAYLYDHFSTMMFREITQNDRIARYYDIDPEHHE